MTLVDTLRNFLESALFSMHISSAGGDSPKVNYVRDVDITPADFDQIIRDEVERIVDERLSETKKVEGEIETKAGTSSDIESGAISSVRTGSNVLQHPEGIITRLMGMLPHTALIALALSLLPLIIHELTGDGKWWDLRFKRIMQDEQNAFLDRQEQWNSRLGLRQVIVQSQAGFTMLSGAGMSENNLRQVREGGVDGNRLALIDMTDHSKELFGPLG